ncbi:hypothetical protein ASPTUDRAFT_529202 [Aspergillus tubingensis CBS 134.48]|uniref:Uncharacterized protein n=1 Tax=Aspergillus tubingensis (strain CBS 134.48) TaxID=767770 RepID=A0A1L9NDN7_ASPTC|nr:hypothetical protein ASPTUDRAFT_529202 [Aspergillus tubingensis CBS 134.48]
MSPQLRVAMSKQLISFVPALYQCGVNSDTKIVSMEDIEISVFSTYDQSVVLNPQGMCWTTIGLVGRLAFADPPKRNSDVGRALSPSSLLRILMWWMFSEQGKTPAGPLRKSSDTGVDLEFLIQPQPSLGSSRLISLRDVAATFVIVRLLEFAPVSLLLYCCFRTILVLLFSSFD